ncbi:MAG: NAD-dependent epimerase/dehydratase family protein [Candidatus Levybacteria bacterium]|nr:NAD-dependent epimerase/dehydratase family protein [Candidatus Levybacteria bacterium]
MSQSVIKQDIKRIIQGLGNESLGLSGKTLLISGGAGFLGSYILSTIHELNKKYSKPCRVISIDNFITGKKRRIVAEIVDRNFIFIEADVTKPINVKEKIDYIIHAAGLASPVYYQKYPLETIESAIFGAKNLLEIARKKSVKSFLYFSSSEIYGDPDPNFIPTPETYRGNVSSIGPRSCYDESKRLGETLCMVYHSLYGISVKIVRPFNIYGPGMLQDDYRVIPTFISQALVKKPLTVHDLGNQTRTFCYISDAIVGFLKVLLSRENGQVYNVGNDDNEISMLGLATIVKKIFNGKVVIQTIKYPKNYPQEEPKRRCPDLTKIKTRLKYRPKVDLEKGLRRVVKWYRDEHII